MSDIKMGELPIMVRLELEDLGDDYHAIPKHLNTMQTRIVELEKALESIRSIVTDVQDGFEVTGSDAEILDLINETSEKS